MFGSGAACDFARIVCPPVSCKFHSYRTDPLHSGCFNSVDFETSVDGPIKADSLCRRNSFNLRELGGWSWTTATYWPAVDQVSRSRQTGSDRHCRSGPSDDVFARRSITGPLTSERCKVTPASATRRLNFLKAFKSARVDVVDRGAHQDEMPQTADGRATSSVTRSSEIAAIGEIEALIDPEGQNFL